MPAVLVEVAFISNEDDVQLLINNQDDIARAIARGVTDFLCQWKENVIMEKVKAFILSNEFITGAVLGFALGALHHYFGL